MMRDNEKRKALIAEATTESTIAGSSFGQLMYLNNPGWTVENITAFAESLHPRAPFRITPYKQGVIAGFTKARNRAVLKTYGKDYFPDVTPDGNLLAQVLPESQGDQDMSLTDQIKSEIADTVYIKARELVAANAIFSIHRIELGDSQFGSQWKLWIEVRENSIDPESDLKLPENKDTEVILTFSPGPQRDKFMAKLMPLLPVYNFFIDEIEIGGGQIYFDLQDLNPDEDGYEAPPARTAARRGRRNPSVATRAERPSRPTREQRTPKFTSTNRNDRIIRERVVTDEDFLPEDEEQD